MRLLALWLAASRPQGINSRQRLLLPHNRWQFAYNRWLFCPAGTARETRATAAGVLVLVLVAGLSLVAVRRRRSRDHMSIPAGLGCPGRVRDLAAGRLSTSTSCFSLL